MPTKKPAHLTPIEELDLNVRVYNQLRRTGIRTVEDIFDLFERAVIGGEFLTDNRHIANLVDCMKEYGFLTPSIESQLFEKYYQRHRENHIEMQRKKQMAHKNRFVDWYYKSTVDTTNFDE